MKKVGKVMKEVSKKLWGKGRISSAVSAVMAIAVFMSAFVFNELDAYAVGHSVTVTSEVAGRGGGTAQPSTDVESGREVNVQANPADGFGVYKWNSDDVTLSNVWISDSTSFTMPDKDVAITIDFRPLVRYTVTFKVVNGSWNDDTTADKTVTYSRLDNQDLTLKLLPADVPAVGDHPVEGCAAGNWDTVPDTINALSSDLTYVYTYSGTPTPPEEPQQNNDTEERDEPQAPQEEPAQNVVVKEKHSSGDSDENNNEVKDIMTSSEEFAKFLAETNRTLEAYIKKAEAAKAAGDAEGLNALVSKGITLETGNWVCFNKKTYTLIERVSELGAPVRISFGYKGIRYSTVIPGKAEIKPTDLCNAEGYCGFLNLIKYYGDGAK